MKNFILILLCCLQSISFAQGGKIKTYLDTKQFYAPNVGNYIEIYMQFVSYSVVFKNEGRGLRAKVLISVEISDSSQTVFSDRYVLESPEAIDSIQDDFYEVIRVQLNPGKYSMKLDMLDVYKEDSEISGSFPFKSKICRKTRKCPMFLLLSTLIQQKTRAISQNLDTTSSQCSPVFMLQIQKTSRFT